MLGGKVARFWSLFFILQLASAPALAISYNRINWVRLTRQSQATVVEIAGERAPNFTTFKQDAPRRVIVDVAECALNGVPSQIGGDGELVEGIITMQYGRTPHTISRVIIKLSREAEYQVTTRSGSLFVVLTEGTGGLLVSAGIPVGPERMLPKPEEAAPASRPDSGVLLNTPSGPEDLSSVVEPRDEALSEEFAEPGPATASGTQPEPEEASRPPVPGIEPPAAPEGGKPAQLSMAAPSTGTSQETWLSDPNQDKDAEIRPKIVAQEDEPEAQEGEGASEESEAGESEAVEEVPVEQEEIPPAPAEAEAEEAAPPPAPPPEAETEEAAPPPAPPPEEEAEKALPPPPPPPEEEAEKVAPPPPPPAEEEAEKAAPPPPPPAEEEEAEEVAPSTPPPAEEEEAEEAAPPPPPPAEREAEKALPPPPPPEPPPAYSEAAERVEISTAIKDMTWVGFQQTKDSSRVFVKTNEPVKYRVVEEGENLVVLELENTRIPIRNNRRFLDTHFFSSAVTMITPKEIEGVSRNVRVEIQVRGHVPYRAVQEENMLYVNFERPR